MYVCWSYANWFLVEFALIVTSLRIKSFELHRKKQRSSAVTAEASLELLSHLIKQLEQLFLFLSFSIYFKFPWHSINLFHATGLFRYPLKASENLWFFHVFRGYRRRLVAWNGLIKNVLSFSPPRKGKNPTANLKI